MLFLKAIKYKNRYMSSFYNKVASFNADHQPSRGLAKQTANTNSRCEFPQSAARALSPAPLTDDENKPPATRPDTAAEQTPHR